MNESFRDVKSRQADEYRHFLTRVMISEMDRRGRRVSDAELAERLGVGTTTLSHWLNNRRFPSLEQIISVIINLEEAEPAKIFGYENQLKQLAFVMLDVKEDGLRYILDGWSKLDEVERKDVLTRIRNAVAADKGDTTTQGEPTNGEPP